MNKEHNERSAGVKRSSRSANAIHRFRRFRWGRVAVEAYRQPPAGVEWAAVSRQVLVAGSRGAATAFDLRYFEIAAGGSSALERHRHAHVVIVLRGEGRIRIGQRWHRLAYLDTCYVGPDRAHQLQNDRAEPFGFLCLVDAQRDRGRPVSGRRRTRDEPSATEQKRRRRMG